MMIERQEGGNALLGKQLNKGWKKIPKNNQEEVSMWVWTTQGFYSAVKKIGIGRGNIMVRARRYDDLERLLESVGSKARITITPRVDYGFRVVIPIELWAQYLSKAAMGISYDNFKDASCAGDELRHNAYMDCWYALLRLQHGDITSRRE